MSLITYLFQSGDGRVFNFEVLIKVGHTMRVLCKENLSILVAFHQVVVGVLCMKEWLVCLLQEVVARETEKDSVPFCREKKSPTDGVKHFPRKENGPREEENRRRPNNLISSAPFQRYRLHHPSFSLSSAALPLSLFPSLLSLSFSFPRRNISSS